MRHRCLARVVVPASILLLACGNPLAGPELSAYAEDHFELVILRIDRSPGTVGGLLGPPSDVVFVDFLIEVRNAGDRKVKRPVRITITFFNDRGEEIFVRTETLSPIVLEPEETLRFTLRSFVTPGQDPFPEAASALVWEATFQPA